MQHMFTSEFATPPTGRRMAVKTEAAATGDKADGNPTRPSFATVFAEARSRQASTTDSAAVEPEVERPLEDAEMPGDGAESGATVAPETAGEVADDDPTDVSESLVVLAEPHESEIAEQDRILRGGGVQEDQRPDGPSLLKRTENDVSRKPDVSVDVAATRVKDAAASGDVKRLTLPASETPATLRPPQTVQDGTAERAIAQGAGRSEEAPQAQPRPAVASVERSAAAPPATGRVPPLAEELLASAALPQGDPGRAGRTAPEALDTITRSDSKVMNPTQTVTGETRVDQTGDLPAGVRFVFRSNPAAQPQGQPRAGDRRSAPVSTQDIPPAILASGPHGSANQPALENPPTAMASTARVISDPSPARQPKMTTTKAGEDTARAIVQTSGQQDLSRPDVPHPEARSRAPAERPMIHVPASPSLSRSEAPGPATGPATHGMATLAHISGASRVGEEWVRSIEAEVGRFTAAGGFASQVETSAPVRPAASLTSLTPDLPRHVAEQLANGFRGAVDKSAEIMLNPAELGRVRISLHTSETGVIVTVLAERPETLDLLRRHSDSLAQEFHEIGYGAAEFSFGQGGDAQTDQGGDDGRETYRPDVTVSESDAPMGATPSPPSTRIALDRVDIRL
ncbi:flagellar hook-length control protein FliK [Roseovarius sp. B08]|uniref:flagellar hook-length control protein FliK n=1 Tax=Roseovarius sp. B08 TaxID=3449223 RepID=UPI003EDBC84E